MNLRKDHYRWGLAPAAWPGRPAGRGRRRTGPLRSNARPPRLRGAGLGRRRAGGHTPFPMAAARAGPERARKARGTLPGEENREPAAVAAGSSSSPRVGPPSVRPRRRAGGTAGAEPSPPRPAPSNAGRRCPRRRGRPRRARARVLPGPALLLRRARAARVSGGRGARHGPSRRRTRPSPFAPSPAGRRPAVGPSRIRWPMVGQAGDGGLRDGLRGRQEAAPAAALPAPGRRTKGGALPPGKIPAPGRAAPGAAEELERSGLRAFRVAPRGERACVSRRRAALRRRCGPRSVGAAASRRGCVRFSVCRAVLPAPAGRSEPPRSSRAQRRATEGNLGPREGRWRWWRRTSGAPPPVDAPPKVAAGEAPRRGHRGRFPHPRVRYLALRASAVPRFLRRRQTLVAGA